MKADSMVKGKEDREVQRKTAVESEKEASKANLMGKRPSDRKKSKSQIGNDGMKVDDSVAVDAAAAARAANVEMQQHASVFRDDGNNDDEEKLGGNHLDQGKQEVVKGLDQSVWQI